MTADEIFNKGDSVPENGEYVCAPCGFHHEYKKGEPFGECTSCMAGGKDGDPEHIEGTGIWEKASTPTEEEEE